jgi:hypothetical protein
MWDVKQNCYSYKKQLSDGKKVDFGRQKSELSAILEQDEENGILTQYMVLGHLASQTELSHHNMDSKKVARTAKKSRGRQKSRADGKKVGPQMLASQTNCHTNIWTAKKLHGQQKSCADGKKCCADGKKVGPNAGGDLKCWQVKQIVTPIYGQKKSCTDSKKVVRTAKKVARTAKKLRGRQKSGTKRWRGPQMLASQTESSHQYTDSKKVARTAKKLRGQQKKLCGRQKSCAYGRQKSWTKRWRGPQMLASQTELSHQYTDSKKVARTAKKLRGRQKS